MKDELIKKIALNNGFKLKEQPNGSLELNPYVYDFAGALLTDLQAQNDELRAHANRLANALVICNAQHEGSYIGGGLVREVLDETPTQSLADIRAEAVIEAANAVVRHNECGFCLHCLLIDHANKIKGAE